jgi:uncharacterized protein
MLAERIAASRLAEMSAQGATLESGVRSEDLPRLAPLLATDPARRGQPIETRIAFRTGPEACPVMRIEARGTLSLTCQRCLAPVDCPIDVDVTLTAATDEEGVGRLAQPFDSVVLAENGDLALREVVEDEILAVLPLAPLHAEASACAATAPAEDGSARAVERSQRPFAGLADLLHRDRGEQDEE